MKKVYMPTTDELYLMQDMVTGYNLYKYILVKAIESLIIEGVNLPNKGILKHAYRYLKENPEIAYSICRLYPEEIRYSEIAQNDIDLCRDLMTNTNNQDRTIYSLDNLSYFENGLCVLSNMNVIVTAAKILSEKLLQNPKYRFEYKDNSLLDRIFACEIEKQEIPRREQEALYFTKIDPAYAIKFDEEQLITHISPYQNRAKLLECSINAYAERYAVTGIDGFQYRDKDILTNPNTEVKRLLKCIKEHQKRY